MLFRMKIWTVEVATIERDSLDEAIAHAKTVEHNLNLTSHHGERSEVTIEPVDGPPKPKVGVWLVVKQPRMDCSDEVILGPFKNAEQAERVLKLDSTDLAYGRTYDTSDVTMIVGEERKIEVSFDADRKRKLRYL